MWDDVDIDVDVDVDADSDVDVDADAACVGTLSLASWNISTHITSDALVSSPITSTRHLRNGSK